MATGYRILRTRDDIRHLLNTLRHSGELPYSLPFIGCLTTTLRGHYLYEAVLDKWPDFSTLILRQNQVEKQELNVHEYYLYGKDEKKIEKLLDADKVIDWKRPFILKLCRWEHRNMLLQCGEKHGGRFEVPPEAPLHIYTYPSLDEIGPIPSTKLPSGHHLGRLRPEHADIVNSNWIYKGDQGMVEQIRHIITHQCNTCIYDQDKPVSWGLSHRDGTYGFAHTLPDYRRQGFSAVISIEIIRQIQELGDQAFGYIATKMDAPSKMMIKFAKATRHFNDVAFLKYKYGDCSVDSLRSKN